MHRCTETVATNEALTLIHERQRSGSTHRVIFPDAPPRTRPGEASVDANDRNTYPKPVRLHRRLQQARPESGPASKSSGAPGPPILVGTHPGSSALDSTSGQWRATAKANKTSWSFESEYAAAPFQGRRSQARSSRLMSPLRCKPELR